MFWCCCDDGLSCYLSTANGPDPWSGTNWVAYFRSAALSSSTLATLVYGDKDAISSNNDTIKAATFTLPANSVSSYSSLTLSFAGVAAQMLTAGGSPSDTAEESQQDYYFRAVKGLHTGGSGSVSNATFANVFLTTEVTWDQSSVNWYSDAGNNFPAESEFVTTPNLASVANSAISQTGFTAGTHHIVIAMFVSSPKESTLSGGQYKGRSVTTSGTNSITINYTGT